MLRSVRAAKASARSEHMRSRAAEASAQGEARREQLLKRLQVRLTQLHVVWRPTAASAAQWRAQRVSPPPPASPHPLGHARAMNVRPLPHTPSPIRRPSSSALMRWQRSARPSRRTCAPPWSPTSSGSSRCAFACVAARESGCVVRCCACQRSQRALHTRAHAQRRCCLARRAHHAHTPPSMPPHIGDGTCARQRQHSAAA
jgi:hypothetical protein